MDGSNEYETLVNLNELFDPFERMAFKSNLQEEQPLVGFMKEFIPVFGIPVAQELVYIIAQILMKKLAAYRKWCSSHESLLPRFGCFQGFGDDEMKPLEVNTGVYE